MYGNLNDTFSFKSSQDEIGNFIKANENTLEILNAIKPQLTGHFSGY